VTPAERADKVRGILAGTELLSEATPPERLLPPGARILTAEEAEKVRGLIALAEVGILTRSYVEERDETLALLGGQQ
jgi:hypothetical protein